MFDSNDFNESDFLFMNNHGHCEISNFRNKDSIIRIAQYIDSSIEYGLNGCCLTDHEALTGHVQFMQRYLELKELKDKYQRLINENKIREIEQDKDIQKNLHLITKMPNDFKIGLGNEIYLLTQEEFDEAKQGYEKGKTHYWHFILIAKDRIGYQQIRQISSESAWKNYFKQGQQERVPTIKEELEEIIGEEKGHIIVSSACLGSYLDYLVLRYFKEGDISAKKKIHKFINWMIKTFGKENVFLELQPCADPNVITIDEEGNETTEIHEQVFVNKHLIKLANVYDLNYQVACDSHYLRPEHLAILNAYLNSDSDGKEDRETESFYKSAYLWKPKELYENLSLHLKEEEVKKAFEGTQKIHNMIEDYSIFHEVIIPSDKHVPAKIDIKGIFYPYYDKYEYIKKFAESEHNQDRQYLKLVEDGFIASKQEFNEINLSRINTEFGIIWQVSENLKQKLSSYYVLVRNIIHEIMWKLSYVGPARGSVTGFYTCYLSNITQLNPLKHKLPEWRHLHQQRPLSKARVA